jgi:signal transduction histidine kinase
MPHLHELLDEHEAELLESWTRCTTPEGTSRDDRRAREGLSAFLTELDTALRVARSGEAPAAAMAPAGDDADLDDVGLDALAATRVYGLMQALILQLAADRRVDVNLAEQLVLASQVNAAIARAAARQARRHHHELHRVAHQLRNPLGSALMAMTLLRSKTDLGANVRLAEIVQRNLQRLQGLIEEAVGDGPGSPPPASETRVP